MSLPSGDMKAALDISKKPSTLLVVMSMLATIQDTDKAFADARIQSRREDQIAMSTGKASPAELQQKNSILPDNFWSEAKVNWNSFAVGTRSHS